MLVIAHVPPASVDALPENGEFYLNVTKRFPDTIVGHFFGHTHEDQFELVSLRQGADIASSLGLPELAMIIESAEKVFFPI